MTKKSIYLVVYYFMKPRRRANTQIKGWTQDKDNLSYDEKVIVSRKLTRSDETMAKIIVDLHNKTVIRNGWGNDLTFDQIFEYFHSNYPQYTTGVMEQLDPEYLEKFKKVEPVQETVAAEPTVSSQ